MNRANSAIMDYLSKRPTQTRNSVPVDAGFTVASRRRKLIAKMKA